MRLVLRVMRKMGGGNQIYVIIIFLGIFFIKKYMYLGTRESLPIPLYTPKQEHVATVYKNESVGSQVKTLSKHIQIFQKQSYSFCQEC